MSKIAIIGAGLAGLTAASRLHTAGHQISLFEKARGVSGRLSTRYADPYQFDHGATYFTAESQAFTDFLAPLQTASLIRPWLGRFGRIEGDKFTASNPPKTRYVAADKMNDLCKYLASDLHGDLDVRLGTLIKDVTLDTAGKVLLRDSEGQQYGPFDAVISAVPQPQFTALFDGFIDPKSAVRDVEMQGCFSLMIGGENLPLPDFDGAHAIASPIGWIAVNSRKPGRQTLPSLLVQSSNQWAEDHLEQAPETVKAALLDALMHHLGVDYSVADHCVLHRWRYASVARDYGQAFWQADQAPIFAVGDWCLGGKVEKAFLSGLAVADYLGEGTPA